MIQLTRNLNATPIKRATIGPPRGPRAVLFSVRPLSACQALPQLSASLGCMDLLHKAAVSHSFKLGYGHLPELFGTTSERRPLQDPHRHVHWIPFCLKLPRRIDHVVAWSQTGFSPAACHVLENMERIYGQHLRPLSIRKIGYGSYPRVCRMMQRHGKELGQEIPRIHSGAIWESYTPYVLRKFLHSRGRRTLTGQLQEEIAERGWPIPIKLESQPFSNAADQNRFELGRRNNKNQPPKYHGWHVRLEFDRPQKGRPLMLGYGSHFGLGQFRPRISDGEKDL